ncbi:hypothetical protein BaRGS_00025757 [Batillaria attramentaria]|uniref:EGF-like domain-containing protein n=1 Tax=Batillaria attramentaria TaxID=370345 RepID=A0ABD0K7L5_9CAEN
MTKSRSGMTRLETHPVTTHSVYDERSCNDCQVEGSMYTLLFKFMSWCKFYRKPTAAVLAGITRTSPCTNGTHSCDPATQTCEEKNNTAGFSCACIRLDYQLDDNDTCVDITDEMREVIGRAVLEMEAAGNITTSDGSVTVEIAGPTGIFDTRSNAFAANDDMDWCAFPSLYSCRNHSTCTDVGHRYKCPCNPGYYDDGTVCFECTDETRFGPGCNQQCDCIFNNTVSCDRFNGTCYCKTGWEGVTCDLDVDECSSPDTHNCLLEHAVCVNTVGGFRCECKPSAAVDASGTCTGPAITGAAGFETDGNRDLQLICDPGNVLELSTITWEPPCLQERDNICILQPQPPWDDGKSVTCTAAYTDGQSSSASFIIDLSYPPPSAPVIEGYQDGQVLKTGGKVKMACSVSGGKPLVMSVDFSCPGHPDNDLDLVSETVVRSVLEINPVTETDDGALCVCSAKWKTSQRYTLTASRILTVEESDDTGVIEINETFIIIVACVGGGVVIFFLVVVIVIWKIRGSSRDGSVTLPPQGTFSANILDNGGETESLYIHAINSPSGEARSVPDTSATEPNPIPHRPSDFGVNWQTGWNRGRIHGRNLAVFDVESK